MDVGTMIIMAIALIGAGAAATYMLAITIPQDVMQHAQDHGRFAGLTADIEAESVDVSVRPPVAKPGFRAPDTAR
ncbi:hypothetical protein [Paraburkholderia sp.]|uniref:hypothetical protein n=1 Tax=Paraburkholderia sp. TaxID=1926495 RepID=UPI00238BA857|nr:hypothetical protein [Paraburkholderia sp.]MDE1182422.1 hypothetical protein [Paraburkholderia sp.]